MPRSAKEKLTSKVQAKEDSKPQFTLAPEVRYPIVIDSAVTSTEFKDGESPEFDIQSSRKLHYKGNHTNDPAALLGPDRFGGYWSAWATSYDEANDMTTLYLVPCVNRRTAKVRTVYGNFMKEFGVKIA